MIFRHANLEKFAISWDRKAITKVKAVKTISRTAYDIQEASPGKIVMLNAAYMYVTVLYCIVLALGLSNRSKT